MHEQKHDDEVQEDVYDHFLCILYDDVTYVCDDVTYVYVDVT